MTNIALNPNEYGLTETRAQEIEQAFKPMLEKMTELEARFNEVVQKEITKETCAEAKRLRLDYVKVRTGTAAIHKELKDFYLKGGRFVDGWKNAQLFASQGIEQKLEAIELHFVNLEKQQKEERRAMRMDLLSAYGGVEPIGLAEMSEDVWSNYLEGVKVAHAAKIEAERKAEEDRIAREKAEAEEREAQRIENIRLKAEAEQREAEIKREREAMEAQRKAEREAEEKRLAEEREAARKEREALEAQARKEREERERIEREAKEAREAVERAEAEEREKAENMLKMGDKPKFVEMLAQLNALLDSFEFKSKAAKAKHIRIKSFINE